MKGLFSGVASAALIAGSIGGGGGGGVGPSAYDEYRYWRLWSPNRVVDNTYHGIGEIELRDTVGGADLTSPASAVASATASSFQVAGTEGHQAFDDLIVNGGAGNYNLWQAAAYNIGRDSWITWDFGVGVTKAIREIRIYPNVDGYARTPNYFLVQGSNDGINFTTVWAFFHEWAALGWQTFTRPDFADGNASKWAIITTAGGIPFGLTGCVAGAASYIEFKDGATTLSTGGAPFSYRDFAGAGNANAFDASDATYWAANDQGCSIIGYTFAAPVEPTDILYRSRDDAVYYAEASKTGFITRSTDGISFEVVSKFGPIEWMDQKQEVTINVLGVLPAQPNPSSAKWRLLVRETTNSAAWVGIQTLEMHATIGGADQCTGGTASASGSTGTSGNAFDGSDATVWQSGSNAVHWIQYEFASAKQVNEIKLKSNAASDAPADFSVQYWDGTVWKTHWREMGVYWGDAVARIFNIAPGIPTAANRWRINLLRTTTDAAWFGVREVEMRATAGGADETHAPPSALGWPISEVLYTTANVLFNNSGADNWGPGSVAKPRWIGYWFVAPVAVNEVVITGAASTTDSPRAFTVDYWNGFMWVEHWRVEETGVWTASQVRTFTKP